MTVPACPHCKRATLPMYYHQGGTCPFCGWVEGSTTEASGAPEDSFAEYREPDPAGSEYGTAVPAPVTASTE